MAGPPVKYSAPASTCAWPRPRATWWGGWWWAGWCWPLWQLADELMLLALGLLPPPLELEFEFELEFELGFEFELVVFELESDSRELAWWWVSLRFCACLLTSVKMR